MSLLTKKSLYYFSYIILGIMIVFPLVAYADLVPCGGPAERACTACDLLVLADNIIKFGLMMAFLIVTAYLVYGAINYWILSFGSSSKVEKGLETIKSSLIGLLLILSSWIIVNTFFWIIAQLGGVDYTGTWFNIECAP